jgi:hypothetical protein
VAEQGHQHLVARNGVQSYDARSNRLWEGLREAMPAFVQQ